MTIHTSSKRLYGTVHLYAQNVPLSPLDSHPRSETAWPGIAFSVHLRTTVTPSQPLSQAGPPSVPANFVAIRQSALTFQCPEHASVAALVGQAKVRVPGKVPHRQGRKTTPRPPLSVDVIHTVRYAAQLQRNRRRVSHLSQQRACFPFASLCFRQRWWRWWWCISANDDGDCRHWTTDGIATSPQPTGHGNGIQQGVSLCFLRLFARQQRLIICRHHARPSSIV